MAEHDEAIEVTAVEEVGPAPPSAALSPVPPPTSGSGELATLWNTRNPAEIVQQITGVANALKGIIDQQDLSVNLGGKKEHVEIEGWQTAGTFLGVQAMTASTARVHPMANFVAKAKRKKWGMLDGKRQVIEETSFEYPVEGWSYEAVAEARTMDGRLVGRGESVCSREEENWFDSSESAVKGMAQTRAQSRALRQALGFIVGLAGYESTPAEEMAANGAKGEGVDLTKATKEQNQALSAALVWLLPEAEARRVFETVERTFGGTMPGPVADVLRLAIDARRAIEEPDSEKTPPARKKSKEQEKREAKKAKLDEQDAAAEAPDELPGTEGSS